MPWAVSGRRKATAAGILQRADEGLEHQVELAGSVSVAAARRAQACRAFGHLIAAEDRPRLTLVRLVLQAAAGLAVGFRQPPRLWPVASSSALHAGREQHVLRPSGTTARTVKTLSARKRALHFLQSTIGSLKFTTWPEASQTLGFMMIEQSRPTMSSRLRHDVLPPGVLDVALQFHAQRAVVPEAVDAAVDLATTGR